MLYFAIIHIYIYMIIIIISYKYMCPTWQRLRVEGRANSNDSVTTIPVLAMENNVTKSYALNTGGGNKNSYVHICF